MLFNKEKKISLDIFEPLLQEFSYIFQESNYLGICKSIRKMIENVKIFNKFEYDLWFMDKFEDDRRDVFFSVYNSYKTGNERPIKSFDCFEKTSLLEAFDGKKIIVKPISNHESNYKNAIYSPVISSNDQLGVLGIYYNDSDVKIEQIKKLVNHISSQLLYLTKFFFLNLEKELFAEIKKIKSNKNLSAERVVEKILYLIQKMIPCSGVTLFLFDEPSKVLKYEASTGLFHPKSPRCFYELGEGLTGWVAKHNKNLRVYNIDDKEELSKISDDLVWANKFTEIKESIQQNFEDWRSYLATPIINISKPDSILGVIRLSKRIYGECFLSFEEKILMEIANFLSVFYFNHANEQFKFDFCFLNEIESALIEKRKPPSYLLHHILKKMCEISDTYDGYIATLDKRNYFEKFVTYGIPLEKRADFIESENSIIGHACAKGDFIRVNSSEERKQYEILKNEAIIEGKKIESIFAIPLKLSDRIVGVVCLHSETPDKFKFNHLIRLKMLANSSAIAIDYATKFYSIKNKLVSITKILQNISGLELPKLYRKSAHEIRKFSRSDVTALYLLDEKDSEKIILKEISASDQCLNEELLNSLTDQERLSNSNSTIAKSILDNEIFLCKNDPNTSGIELNPTFKCELAMPISNGSIKIGCIWLGFLEHREILLDDDDLSILRHVSNQIGLSINTSRHLQERQMIQKQREKLDKSVTISNLVTAIAHDFDNRLSAIKGNTRNLLDISKKMKENDKKNEVIQETNKMRETIENLHRLTSRIKRYKSEIPEDQLQKNICKLYY